MSEKTWIKDDNGNQCSVEYWGSEEEARKALVSNKDCKDCSDCFGCSRCWDCSRCSRCSGCFGCFGCSRCFGCWDCSRCSGCFGCFGCSRCFGCSGCSDLAYLNDKTDVQADPTGMPVGPPSIPKIENIHQAIYAAASNPKALEMDTWHTCEKTHCRAGWVVTLAGPEGKALERFYNTELAAMLIYDASAPNFKINPARFYDQNEDAIADMRRLAGA